MAGKSEPKAGPASRNRDLAYPSGEDVSGPLIVILAALAVVLVASFLYNLDEALNPSFPALSERALPGDPSNS